MDLTAEGGTLTPKWDPSVTTYTAKFPLVTDVATIRFTAAPGVSVEVDGKVINDGQIDRDLGVARRGSAILVARLAEEQTNYTVELTRVPEESYIKADNVQTDRWFGWAVAVSGDTLVVGAPLENGRGSGIRHDEAIPPDDGTANESGAVYVYVRTAAGWRQQAVLKASNADAGDWFGDDVAIEGDTIVVGASREASNSSTINQGADNNDAAGAGAVYVFTRANGRWSEQAYLKAPNTGGSDNLGKSVAIHNGVIVALAPGEDGSGAGVDPAFDDNTDNAGAGYVFEPVNDGWYVTYLKASPPVANDQPQDIAVSGSWVAIGNPRRALEAVRDGMAAPLPNAGVVHLFERVGDAGGWVARDTLTSEVRDAYDLFGAAVSLDRDWLVVGAPGQDAEPPQSPPRSGWNQGEIETFVRRNGRFQFAGRRGSPRPSQVGCFGASLAASNGRLIVGAYGEGAMTTDGLGCNRVFDTNGGVGAAYVFSRDGDEVEQRLRLLPEGYVEGDQFGSACAVDGDTFAVGAHFDSSAAVGVNSPFGGTVAQTNGGVFVFE